MLGVVAPRSVWLQRFANAGIIGAISIALFWIVDAGFGLAFPTKVYAERLTAAAYQGEPYFSEQFLEESFTQPGGWETPRGTRLILPRPYDGNAFHVDVLAPTGLAYRRTYNPESEDPAGERLILLLGGSTVYDSEVPDELTVASQLSALLNRQDGPRYRVLNAGVTSVNTAQERERLELELARGLKPWAVVTLNGVNDVNQGVYFGQPEGVMFSGDQRNRVREWLGAVLPLNIWRSIRARALRANARVAPEHVTSARAVEALSADTADVYVRNIAAMHVASHQAGARFWSVLQPHLFSAQYARDTDIEEAEQLTERTLPGARAVFDSSYRALRGAVDKLQLEGVRASDASQAFAGKRSDIFLDMAHVNSVGNRMLAEYLAGLILADASPR